MLAKLVASKCKESCMLLANASQVEQGLFTDAR